MGEAHGPYQPMPGMFYLYVPDCDDVYLRAVAAGGKSIMEPTDHPYGDRSGAVQDAVRQRVVDRDPHQRRNRVAKAGARLVRPFSLIAITVAERSSPLPPSMSSLEIPRNPRGRSSATSIGRAGGGRAFP